MTRDQLLKPGEYASLPKSMLADPDISPGAKLVLMVLIDHLGQANASAWPGPARIAKLTALTRRGVQKAIDQLVAAGVVSKLGLSPKGTNDLVVNGVRQRTECASEQSALRTQCASEQSALGVANDVRYPPRTECATPSAQSAPELLNRTTETKPPEVTTEVCAAVAAQLPASRSRAQAEEVPAASKKQSPIDRIVASPNALDAMIRYLCFGEAGLDSPAADLPPGPMNWRQYIKSPSDPNAEAWGSQAFMGFYWFSVCVYRAQRGLPLTLPVWGRLAGDIKTLRKTMTNKQLFDLIACVTNRFDVIKFMCGRAGLTLDLNEASLNNGMIKSTASAYLAMDGHAIEKLHDQYARSLQPAFAA